MQEYRLARPVRAFRIERIADDPLVNAVVFHPGNIPVARTMAWQGVRVGDYYVNEGDRVYYMTEDEFQRRFEPVDQETVDQEPEGTAESLLSIVSKLADVVDELRARIARLERNA